jgi:hypothetical protein
MQPGPRFSPLPEVQNPGCVTPCSNSRVRIDTGPNDPEEWMHRIARDSTSALRDHHKKALEEAEAKAKYL